MTAPRPSSSLGSAFAPAAICRREALDAADAALLQLLIRLRDNRYHFVTPTPATHARVVARPDYMCARTVEDVLGWSLPFDPTIIPRWVYESLKGGGMLEELSYLARSRVRVSALHDRLYLHSAYPTLSEDAVFFGPDSYRFADLIAAELDRCPAEPQSQIVDIGTGSGAGAIVAATTCPDASVMATDINPQALRLARINAIAAGVTMSFVQTSALDGIEGLIDVAMINPPYIIDDSGRAYRDGGAMHGGQLSLDLTHSAMNRLAPGGRVILYTGSAIVNGRDPLRSKSK
jgi:precorrin-6B methylase 2